MSHLPTIDAQKVMDLLETLRGLGIPSGPLCRAAELQAVTLREPGARVSVAALERLLEAAERRSRDPLIGLHAGQRAQPRGVVAYLVMSSPALGEGLGYLEQFSALVIDGIRIRIETRGSTAALIFDRERRVLGTHRHIADYLLMATLRIMRRAVGPRLRVRRVDVRHNGELDHGALSAAFGCPIRGAQPDYRIVLPAAMLRVSSRLANPLVAAQIEKFAAGLNAGLHSPDRLSGHVAEAVRALIARGAGTDRVRVARHLGLGHRTLQRRLHREGTAFKAVREAVVREVSEALLSNPDLSVESIALSVGFSDTAAFSRAFKRWAGRPPRQHRKRHA